MFAPVFNAFTPYSRNENESYLKVNKTQGGHTCSVDSKICLAIVLSWSRTQGASWVQSMLFGITGLCWPPSGW